MPDQSVPITRMPESERPRERLLALGASSLSAVEILAILLRTGTPEENALQLATRILSDLGGIAGLARTSAMELAQIKGIGSAKAAQIMAALELGQRVSVANAGVRPQITRSQDVVNLVADMMHLTQEQIRLVLLDTNNRVVAITTIYTGTVNLSVVRVSEIYREAIVRNSPAVILVHNHPSGDPNPSPEDVDLTRILIAAGELLDIQLLDHIIVGDQQWKSLRELGLAFDSD